MIKKLYDWILSWAKNSYALVALFILALCESFFFPIPPDVLLIALAIGFPKKSFRFALICSIGSVLGGCIGYFIGLKFMEIIGNNIINFYNLSEQVNYISLLYNKWDSLAVFIAGFTPVPYKVFTIFAGVFKVNFPVFVLASACSRTLRFMLLAGLIYYFGPNIKKFIDKYFNILALIFVVLVIAGFFVINFF
ncbi:MAG: cytochrome B [Desulfobacteraceae bacterium 4572_130]|nr:MAG: cytochrome B [Desulfobacteraceae bacterium 4572_130]